jgi:predicted NUDIX family NTP pyrophosphohydrolase
MKKSPNISAGLLMFRRKPDLQVLLAHPGGPFWKNKDDGAWTIPKGLLDGQEPLEAAKREFQEETGLSPSGPFLDLGFITQKAGKIVHAWAFEGDADPATMKSNEIQIEWPAGSGRMIDIPEVDRCEWLSPKDAKRKINPAQVELIERLERQMADDG